MEIVLDQRFQTATAIPHSHAGGIIIINRRGEARVIERPMSWYCSACGSYNAQDDDRRCRVCGTPR